MEKKGKGDHSDSDRPLIPSSDLDASGREEHLSRVDRVTRGPSEEGGVDGVQARDEVQRLAVVELEVVLLSSGSGDGGRPLEVDGESGGGDEGSDDPEDESETDGAGGGDDSGGGGEDWREEEEEGSGQFRA